ncbi:GGDEF domain-containing protein [Marinomonas atlantica]|uniref:GGDEF domain-containing protein n=1 Tax=Marinomonas atlantica TaxID=1806668 RepID=UPI0012E870C3|nr:hypothetical protein [Marinomonas atlantica]
MDTAKMDALKQDVSQTEAVHEPLIQRDFLLQLRKVDQVLLDLVASSAGLTSYIEQVVKSIWTLFPNTLRPCVIWCDKELVQWRILNFQDWSEMTDSLGALHHIPQTLSTFVASPSRPFAREQNLSTKTDWTCWHKALNDHFLETCDMVSFHDENKNWLTFCLFSPNLSNETERRLYYWSIEQVLQALPYWFNAIVRRLHTDVLLQEHTNEVTGLLQSHAFDKALDMMLRDARRYFQRLAYVTVLVNEEANADELKLLSDTLRETLRDNDLLANKTDHEFVMAMRIMQLDDAPIVAQKIERALLKVDPSQVSILSGDVKIGMSLYPEQADHKKLHVASVAAAKAVSEQLGYRLEYYGQFVQCLDEAYDV